MSVDIGQIVSQCLNNSLIQPYYMKKRNMTYEEKKLQEENFSRMIGYCVLFKEADGIEEYMRLSDKSEQIQFLKLRIADKLGIPHEDMVARKEDIIRYAFENFVRDGYVFHSGNSDSILRDMKNGLDVSEDNPEKRAELQHIASIYAKYGANHPLGWALIDIKYKKNGWFYDCNPYSSLYYSNSPEWFGQFCGNSGVYAWGTVPEEYRYGYANRDYDACYFAITTLMEKIHMNEEDRNEILQFFNKCWALFAHTEPYLAFVPIRAIKDEKEIDLFQSYYIPSLFPADLNFDDDDRIFEDVIEGGSSLMGINICCDKRVEPEHLSCVNLSPILPRFKVEEFARKRQMTIEDCVEKLKGLDMDTLVKFQEMLNQFPKNDNGRSL